MTQLTEWLNDHPYVTLALCLSLWVLVITSTATGCISAFAGLTGWWH